VGEYLLLKELLGYDSEHGESELGTLLARPVSQVQATPPDSPVSLKFASVFALFK
jgi:hypothetical protein